MNVVHRGFILRELIKRDFQSRYVGSVLGVGWSIVHPFWQLLLFTFVFGLVMKMRAPPELTDSFAIFLFAGLVPWIAVQEGVTRSAAAITDNATLIKKLSFPPELLVFSSVTGALIQSVLAATILFVALIWRQDISWSTLPWLIVVVPFQIALTLGLGLVFSALNVFLRDVGQFLTIAMNAWFYLTPIVYPISLVSKETDKTGFIGVVARAAPELLAANPLTALVELYRFALMGGPGFSGSGLWLLPVFSLTVLGFGWFLFHRLRPGFADEL